MSADDKARKLAEKMALDVIKAYFECKEVEYLLPYATAILAAEKTLRACVPMLEIKGDVRSCFWCEGAAMDGREIPHHKACPALLRRAALSTIKGLLP